MFRCDQAATPSERQRKIVPVYRNSLLNSIPKAMCQDKCLQVRRAMHIVTPMHVTITRVALATVNSALNGPTDALFIY